MQQKGNSVADEYSAALFKFSRMLPVSWEVIDSADACISWALFRCRDVSLPCHGWKIHISCAAHEASKLFSTVAPHLVVLGAPFKIPRSLQAIVRLNSGDAGPTQVGKVITVYPLHDQHASEIAEEMDRVWPHSRGPEVPSDFQIRPGAAVSLRYGIFHSAETIVGSDGIHTFAFRTADGTLVADDLTREVRSTMNHLRLPVPCTPPRAVPVCIGESLSGRVNTYVPLALLKESPRSKIFLALEAQGMNTVILKVGIPGVAGDLRGKDIRDRLRSEFDLLSALDDCNGVAPKAIEWVGGAYPVSVTEDLRGEPVSSLPRSERIKCLHALADSIVCLHNAGIVHGDIKLDNLLYRSDGRVNLIDFELAGRIGEVASGAGTTGYLAPEVVDGLPLAPSRDIFALGACAAEAFLGIPLGLLPVGPGRWRALLLQEGAEAASDLVFALAATNPEARPTALVARCLIEERLLVPGCAINHPSPHIQFPERNWLLRSSAGTASLVKNYAVNDESGLRWRNHHFMSPFECEGLNIGAAGIVIGLATVDHALGRKAHTHEIDGGAAWLARGSGADKPAGFFTGNAGVAVALALAGRCLRNPEYVRASRNRIARAAGDQREIDLFSGTAGVIFAVCLLQSVIGEDWPLEVGERAYEALNDAFCGKNGLPLWSAPGGSAHYLGCAHGSAGNAMALACWGHSAAQPDARDLALETFHSLFVHGRTSNGAALRMSPDSDKCHAPSTWCHGVAGYLWCMLQAFGDTAELKAEIDWAIDILAELPAVGTPTYCHGLAGQLELWRMIGAIPRYSDLARVQQAKTAGALRVLHSKIDGTPVWCSDNPAITTPDLWIGFLGPATALAMLAANAKAPLLSAEWLGACAVPERTFLSTGASSSPL